MNQLPHDNFERLLDEISFIGSAQPELTPRTKKLLLSRLHQRQLIIALENEQLAGWGLVEPVAKNVVELGFLYVKPEFRSTRAFHDLARELVLRPETVLFATYNPKLLNYVKSAYHFSDSSLAEFNRLTNGRFTIKRLNIDALKSIRSRMAKSKPFYAILDRT